MTTLFENPIPILVAGGLAVTIAIIVYVSTRSGAAFAAVVAAIALTLALLAVEHFVVTEREQVEDAVADVIAAVKANDMQGVLDHTDPAAAKVRAEVQSLMPEIKVNTASSSGRTDVTLDEGAQPLTATTRIVANLVGIHGKSGVQVLYLNQRVDMHWIKRDGRWKLDDFTAYYEGQPIDAAGSARGNVAVPRH
jgi:hypothetical protein